VAIHNLMEDAATAEISRSQIWQWVHNEVRLDTGDVVSAELVRRILDEVTEVASQDGGGRGGRKPLRTGASTLRAGGAGRRLRRLPHHSGLRGGPGSGDHLDMTSVDSFGHLDDTFLSSLDRQLAEADRQLSRGTRRCWHRQPVHTVYVPADRLEHTTVASWGADARALFDDVTPDEIRGRDHRAGASVTAEVHSRVRAKLNSSR
jgi:hypothetical protein